ncbi:response regulator transcription factor [Burkholderia diffusa]|uniref:response regulator transcription factor n=1 Tax=Burkholderia diffusa TaxID=488732 RepID=UPI000752089C|nr:response regulator transcription factor [Burkholderia diffusa]KVG27967.1 LuxR family transcriptional regulator [Burkholderia diffusa]
MLANTTINVVIADDHPAIVAGIASALRGLRSIHIVGVANNSTEIVEFLSQHPCDLLITDFAMPGGKFNDGLGMLTYLRTHFPDLPIIVFTGLDGVNLTNKLLKLGVKAIVNKADDVGHLISAIYTILANTTYLSPSVTRAQPEQRSGRRHLDLTKSETEVLRLYVSGMSVSEIAAHLNRTKQTISAQKIKAMQKLGVERDADLYKIVYESQWGVSAILRA